MIAVHRRDLPRATSRRLAVIMSDLENWISLPQAVAIVKGAIGVSQGPAQQKLIAICESGDVRARWSDHYLKTRPAIHKRDWIGADIDWANFRVVKADGAGMAGVEFSEDDLNGWAAKNVAVNLPNTERQRPVPKRAAAKEAVDAIYPNGVPSEVHNGPLCSAVVGWLKTNRPLMVDMDNKTILRAAGRAA
jgi:hypothetical protein